MKDSEESIAKWGIIVAIYIKNLFVLEIYNSLWRSILEGKKSCTLNAFSLNLLGRFCGIGYDLQGFWIFFVVIAEVWESEKEER